MTTFLIIYLLLGLALGYVSVTDQTNKSEPIWAKAILFITTTIFWLPVLISVVIFPPKLAPSNVRTNSQTNPIESVDVIEVETVSSKKEQVTAE